MGMGRRRIEGYEHGICNCGAERRNVEILLCKATDTLESGMKRHYHSSMHIKMTIPCVSQSLADLPPWIKYIVKKPWRCYTPRLSTLPTHTNSRIRAVSLYSFPAKYCEFKGSSR